MKLIRFGESGKEKPGVIINDAWFDVSEYITDFDEKFFESERLLIEVHQELSRIGYNYDKTAVSHSLSDMVREGILSRVGTLRNYRYIQKKPLFEK